MKKPRCNELWEKENDDEGLEIKFVIVVQYFTKDKKENISFILQYTTVKIYRFPFILVFDLLECCNSFKWKYSSSDFSRF